MAGARYCGSHVLPETSIRLAHEASCNSGLQVADLQEMLFGWRGGFAAVLNSEWDDEQDDTDLASFVKSWESVYCFRPLDIQARPHAAVVCAPPRRSCQGRSAGGGR